MKKILFLLLFPSLALAQYQGNANQKITLGEQTTADGLVFRGVASIDTVTATSKITRANKQDTSAFILLDTVTNLLWHYKTGSNAWTQAGGGVSVSSFSAGTTGLTPSTATTGAVTLGGTLAVANGGTNNTSYISGAIPFSNGTTLTSDTSKLFYDATNLRLGLGTSNTTLPFTIFNSNSAMLFQTPNTGRGGERGFYVGHTANVSYIYNYQNYPIQIATNNTPRIQILGNGDVGIGTETPAVQFHTTGSVRFATFTGGGTTTLSVDNTGNLARTSSIELKKDVTPIRHGLNEILQINPINFNWINEDKFGNENENGFIAEDVMSIIPNVVAADAHGLFMDYTKLIPILTKAIQEQQTFIKALEQRILILENK